MHTSWHFDLGNTNTRTIGASGRICATTKTEALERLRRTLDVLDVTTLMGGDDDNCGEYLGDGYINVYFNSEVASFRHLNEPEECRAIWCAYSTVQ